MEQITERRKLRVAVIGDIHAHESVRSSLESVFAELNNLCDILVLCGDLTNTGSPEEAKRLREDLRVCHKPILAVLGNHDHHHDSAVELRQVLKEQVIFLEDETFVIGSVGFAGTKGFGGGFDSHMLTYFGEKENKEYVNVSVTEALKLENDLRLLSTEKIVVVLHYSPIEATVRGEPKEIYPFLGCTRLAEAIDRFPVNLVVHGHAHHGEYEGKTLKGVPVYNCSKDVLQSKWGKPYTIFTL